MSFTVVICNEGHRIHAAHRLAGKTLPCPKCGIPVTVPEAKSDSLSDTAVLRILGDSSMAAEPDTRVNEPTTRACPKCSVQIGLYLSVCPFCHCYAGAVSDYWEKMLRDAGRPTRQTA